MARAFPPCAPKLTLLVRPQFLQTRPLLQGYQFSAARRCDHLPQLGQLSSRQRWGEVAAREREQEMNHRLPAEPPWTKRLQTEPCQTSKLLAASPPSFEALQCVCPNVSPPRRRPGFPPSRARSTARHRPQRRPYERLSFQLPAIKLPNPQASLLLAPRTQQLHGYLVPKCLELLLLLSPCGGDTKSSRWSLLRFLHVVFKPCLGLSEPFFFCSFEYLRFKHILWKAALRALGVININLMCYNVVESYTVYLFFSTGFCPFAGNGATKDVLLERLTCRWAKMLTSPSLNSTTLKYL